MLIQTPDVGRRLQQLYRLQRIPSTTLAPEIIPVVLVDDVIPRDSPDDRPCVGQATSSGAELPLSPQVGLRFPDPPPTPTLRVELERIAVVSNARFSVRLAAVFGSAPPNIAPAGQKNYRDLNLRGKPQMEIVTQVAAVPSTTSIIIGGNITPAGQQNYHILDLQGLQLYMSSPILAFNSIWVIGDDDALNVTFWWREQNILG